MMRRRLNADVERTKRFLKLLGFLCLAFIVADFGFVIFGAIQGGGTITVGHTEAFIWILWVELLVVIPLAIYYLAGRIKMRR